MTSARTCALPAAPCSAPRPQGPGAGGPLLWRYQAPGGRLYEDLDEELWKLGILAKTKHNEVAPAQHELAPIFTTTQHCHLTTTS